MKYGVGRVINLIVFDEEGGFVTELDTIKYGRITINENGNGTIFVEDALLDMNLLQFQHGDSNKEITDFELYAEQMMTKTITFNKNKKFKMCKLFATSEIRNTEDQVDSTIVYEIPNAKILNRLDYDTSVGNTSVFDVVFEIIPNENGDLFNLHI